ncbi:MAG: hypothetical protein FD167_1079 [bacterium]|nr:MAG: hypothetical protein FD167_1079 [bacterium]
MESSKEPKEQILEKLIKLVLIGRMNNHSDHTGSKYVYSRAPFRITMVAPSVKAPTDLALSCFVFQKEMNPCEVFTAYFLDVEKHWRIVQYHQGKWINELSKTLTQLETENYSDVDDSSFFQMVD